MPPCIGSSGNTTNAVASAISAMTTSNHSQNTITIIFGTLPIVLALFGLVVAYLQLRRARVVLDVESLRTDLSNETSFDSTNVAVMAGRSVIS